MKYNKKSILAVSLTGLLLVGASSSFAQSVPVEVHLKGAKTIPKSTITINNSKPQNITSQVTKFDIPLDASASKIIGNLHMNLKDKNFKLICKETPVTKGTNIIVVKIGGLSQYPTCVIWTYNVSKTTNAQPLGNKKNN